MTKNIDRFKATALSMILPIFLMGEAHATVQDIHEIADLCTDSERVMKDYALTGMKITYHNPQKTLKEVAEKMDKEMSDLEKAKMGGKLHAEEEALIEEWHKIEHNLTETPVKESAKALHDKVNKFAQHCEKLANELEATVDNHAEHYVLLIERLNLDTQRLAADYTMKAWGALDDAAYYPEVKATIEDYMKDYDELMVANDKMVSPKVKAKLKELKHHFMPFEMMIESHSGRFVPLLIAKKADKIDAETEKILKEEEMEVEK